MSCRDGESATVSLKQLALWWVIYGVIITLAVYGISRLPS